MLLYCLLNLGLLMLLALPTTTALALLLALDPLSLKTTLADLLYLNTSTRLTRLPPSGLTTTCST